MIFQIVATIALACTAIYAYSQGKLAPRLTKLTILITICGEYLVLFPNQTTVIASFFGVGRGADLMFYLWVLLTIVMLLNVHLRLRGLDDRLVQLTRQLALHEAAAASREPGLSNPAGR